MKRFIPLAVLFVLATSLLTSCDLIQGIFNAGIWTGIIIVVVILALIIWIIARLSGGRRR